MMSSLVIGRIRLSHNHLYWGFFFSNKFIHLPLVLGEKKKSQSLPFVLFSVVESSLDSFSLLSSPSNFTSASSSEDSSADKYLTSLCCTSNTSATIRAASGYSLHIFCKRPRTVPSLTVPIFLCRTASRVRSSPFSSGRGIARGGAVRTVTGCSEGGGGLAVVKSIMTVGGGMIIIAEEPFFSQLEHVMYVHALGDVTREPASCAA